MSPSASVFFQLVPRTQLDATQKHEMFELLTRHFDGVTSEQFARDLAEKNLVLLLRREEALVGFSTLLSYTTLFEDKTVNVIYSGDTIVAPDAWGTMTLPRAWVAGVEALRASLPSSPCYWLLLTSGFRTYRFLPVFWREFFPRFDAQPQQSTQRLLNHLAAERFGSQFDSRHGIVRFKRPQLLRGSLNAVPDGRKDDPHVAYFLSCNPGCVHGDELVCLTELGRDNLTAAGHRITKSLNCAIDGHHC